MDVRSYEKLQDALTLLEAIAQSEEEFEKGNWLTQEQMEREVQKTLAD